MKMGPILNSKSDKLLTCPCRMGDAVVSDAARYQTVLPSGIKRKVPIDADVVLCFALVRRVVALDLCGHHLQDAFYLHLVSS